MDLLYNVSVILIPLIAAVTLHEAAHGYAAWLLGDDTAKRLGRITLNPIRHIDPIGTVALPLVMYLSAGFLFGWAKPVPVNQHRLARPRQDMLWIALAGPATNIVLALVAAWLQAWMTLLIGYTVADGNLLGPGAPADWFLWLQDVLLVMVHINVILAVVNMIPIPPLDGGRILTGILPEPLAERFAAIGPWGLIAVIGLLFVLPMLGSSIGIELDGFVRLLHSIILFLIDGIEWVVS